MDQKQFRFSELIKMWEDGWRGIALLKNVQGIKLDFTKNQFDLDEISNYCSFLNVDDWFTIELTEKDILLSKLNDMLGTNFNYKTTFQEVNDALFKKWTIK